MRKMLLSEELKRLPGLKLLKGEKVYYFDLYIDCG